MRASAFTCALLASLTLARGVSAQGSDQKAAAEHLFEEGRAKLLEKSYDEACPKLAESQRLDPSIGTALYLAACYEKVGKSASAWAMFREAGELSAREGDAKRGALARARAEALEPTLSRLAIVVPPPARVPGLAVARDGAEVGAVLWGSAVPVDPGEHRVVASAPGKRPFETTVDVRGPRVDVTVPVLDDALAVDPGPAAPAPAPTVVAEPEGRGNGQRAIGIALGGAGVVGLLAGVVFAVRTSALVDDARARGCDTGKSPVQCPDDANGREGFAAMSDARTTWRPLQVGALLVGAGLLVAGGVVFFTAPSSQSPSQSPRAVTLSPVVGAGGAGLVVGGAL
jgi:serine/threonine-protein kinase